MCVCVCVCVRAHVYVITHLTIWQFCSLESKYETYIYCTVFALITYTIYHHLCNYSKKILNEKNPKEERLILADNLLK